MEKKEKKRKKKIIKGEIIKTGEVNTIEGSVMKH